MPEQPTFFFISCQIGAEPAVKREVTEHWPDVHAAYSRPGFVTFKVPADHPMRPDFDPQSVFARAHAVSLGRAAGDTTEERAAQAWQILGPRPVQRVHVWARDLKRPGDAGYEPKLTPAVLEVRQAIRRACPQPAMLARDDADPAQPARHGDAVLDCVLVEPDEWRIGCHQVVSSASRWPGGIIPLELPADAVSRAWLKMEEALRWSELPIPKGARVAELGSSPGGASQALLAHGFEVLGVDPAEMDPRVSGHPNFTHLRRRVSEARRRDFRKVRWLMADMNVAPAYTLDAVEGIVTHPEVNVRGLLLTLKLFEWEMTAQVPEYVDRVRSWGFNEIWVRQLVHNRQEFCLAALCQPFVRKPAARHDG